MPKSRDYWEGALWKALNEKADLEKQDEEKRYRSRLTDTILQKKMGKLLRRIEYIRTRIRSFQPTAWKRLLSEE